MINNNYYDKKIEELIEETDDLVEALNGIEYIDQVYGLIYSYQKNNSAQFNYLFLNDYLHDEFELMKIKLRSSENPDLYILIDSRQLAKIEFSAFYKKEPIRIFGEIRNDQIMPFKIDDDFIYDVSEEDLLSMEIVDTDMVVEYIEISEFYKNENTDIGLNLDWFRANYSLEETKVINDDISYYIFNNPFTNFKEVVIQYHFEMSGKNQVIYIYSTQQSLEQFVELLKPYIFQVFIIGLFLAMIITLLMSFLMNKPIKKIIKKANQVAQLEFTNPLIFSGHSELSALAESINLMSDNLQKYLKELEMNNNELNISLEKEKLIEKRRREFISNASHEIKTPLGIAKGHMEAIKDGVKVDKHNEYINISIEEIDRVNEVVLSLLELIRNEHNEEMKDLELREVETLIDGMIAYFDVLAENKNILIKKSGNYSKAYYERKSLRNVISNLLSNATQYGKVNSCIHIEGRYDEELLTIIIRNEVENIDEIDIEKIWEKFYTVDLSHNDESSGTGLGLPIVKSILDQYNSHYYFEKIGNYLEFSFTLKK